jgi:hypothetical protein
MLENAVKDLQLGNRLRVMDITQILEHVLMN